ncbi:mCG148001 [Mus musculus]|nr:mCG148001 [Mus musculus]
MLACFGSLQNCLEMGPKWKRRSLGQVVVDWFQSTS